MKPTLTLTALLLAPLAALHAADAPPPATKPNIIVIVSDDQGYADAGFQGSKIIATPHLDEMAREGVRCSRAYVTGASCSASRAGLMSGRYQQKFGFYTNMKTIEQQLPATETLLPEFMKRAGYHTAMVGKWHLGTISGRPYERGFDEFFGFTGGGHDYFKLAYEDAPKSADDYNARLERNGVAVKAEGYLTDVFGDEAARIIRQERKEPLFLYLSFNAPHTPTQAPKDRVAQAHPDLKEALRRTYAAQISAMDAAIGRVHAALKETGQDQNTCIFFFSDNGGAIYKIYDNTPLRAHKGTLYEGGIRVPFLAHFPGRIPAGSVCDLPVTALDVLTTACALAGHTPDAKHSLDSRNMLPVLMGEAKQPVHEKLYWKIPEFGSAMSDGKLKLVVRIEQEPELYDVAADIGETNDLAKSRPEDVARLMKSFMEWDATTAPPLWGRAEEERNPGSPRRSAQDHQRRLYDQIAAASQ